MAKDYKYKLLFREMARPQAREARPEAQAPLADVPTISAPLPDEPDQSNTLLASPPLDAPALVEEPVYDYAPVPPEPDETTLPTTEAVAQPKEANLLTPEPEPRPLEPKSVVEAVNISEPPPKQAPNEPEGDAASEIVRETQEFEPEPAPIEAPPPPEPNVAPVPETEATSTMPDQVVEPQATPVTAAVPEPAPELIATEAMPSVSGTAQNDTSASMTPPAAASPQVEPPRAAEQDRPSMPDRIRLPRVLLTNDDGIDAPGLQVLAEVAATFADEVWIIAPEHDQSGTSMSLALHHPRRIYRRGARSLAVSGSPADCIALASYMLRADPPALVLSGINAGQNVGDDANLSGTLGAALTALTLGIPSIAISQCYTQHRDNINWNTARARLPTLLQELLTQGWPKDHCLSINLPPLPPEEVTEALWTRQAPRTINGYVVDVRTDLRGFDYCWLNIARPDVPAPEDTDLWAIEQGCISVSCLSLDRSRPVPPESISLTGDD